MTVFSTERIDTTCRFILSSIHLHIRLQFEEWCSIISGMMLGQLYNLFWRGLCRSWAGSTDGEKGNETGHSCWWTGFRRLD